MWKDYSQEYIEEAWKNSKKKIDFMKKIGIINRDYRACERAIQFFHLNEVDLGSELKLENKLKKPRKNIIGCTFGSLHVVSLNIDKSELYHRTYYNCFCDCCKNYCIKRTDALNSQTTDCGCVSKRKNRMDKINDITGNIYGFLEVLSLDEEKTFKNNNVSSKVYWKCKCHKCNKIVSVLGTSLKTGNSTTCGCIRSNKLRKDMAGQTWGYLYFIEPDEDETLRRREQFNDSSLWWKCKCLNCGKELSVNGSEARLGKIISCGCSVRSRGEILIKKFLDENNYKYKEQYSFSNLYGNDRLLKFDFAIFDNDKIFTLIEFQGEQHYIAKEFFGGEEQLKKQQYYDQKKRDYCKDNNINLLEIPYKEINNINNILNKELRR